MDQKPILDFTHPERVANTLHSAVRQLRAYSSWLADQLTQQIGSAQFNENVPAHFVNVIRNVEKAQEQYSNMVPRQEDGESGHQYGKRLWALFQPTITAWEEINHDALLNRIKQYLEWVVAFKDERMTWPRDGNQFVNDTLFWFQRERDAWLKETKDLQRADNELFAYLSEHWKRCERVQTGDWVIEVLKHGIKKPGWKYEVETEFVWHNNPKSTMKISRRMHNEDGSACYAVIHQNNSLRVVGIMNEGDFEKEPGWVLNKPSPHEGRWTYTADAKFIPRPESGRGERQLNVTQRMLNEQDEPCYLVYDPFSREGATHVVSQEELDKFYRLGEKQIGGKQ